MLCQIFNRNNQLEMLKRKNFYHSFFLSLILTERLCSRVSDIDVQQAKEPSALSNVGWRVDP